MSPHPPAEDKKRAILEAAKRLLARRGYQDVLLDDVARAAGVAKGTLFLYYRSKDELVAAVFADLVDRLGDALEALAASRRRGLPLLTEAARAILARFDADSDFLAQTGVGRFPGCGKRSCESLMGRFKRNQAALQNVLRRCAADGLFPARGLPAKGPFLFSLCRSLLVRKMMLGERGPLARRAGEVAEFFVHGARGRR